MPDIPVKTDLVLPLRQLAEQQLREGSANFDLAYTASADALGALYQLSSNAQTASSGLKLLHELQTYQVELELQQAQLQQQTDAQAANHEPGQPALPDQPQPLRIVAIGASAGGLQALEQFLLRTPPDSGLAWIVVQHLDPGQKALLAELLQRVTSMPVKVATQGMAVRANQIYVIPPNSELRLLKGKLQLTKPAEPLGRRLPVDILFRSLAEDQAERAVAVILSGMGQDGTLGVAAVKAAGGLTAAQLPDDAQFNSMPATAIASGHIDLVATAAALPDKILMQLQHSQVTLPPQKALQDVAPSATPLQRIISRLQQQTRHDFSSYKLSTLQRRIERRMAIHGCTALQDYAALLEQQPQEVALLFKELLIGVTSFFRDGPVWQYLSVEILPLLLQQASEQPLRAWCLGCSTGEEAYSLALAFCQLQAEQPQYQQTRLQIFASDISPDAIAVARRGQYSLSQISALSPEQQAFFVRHDSYYQISQSIRDMVLFAEHDAILDPPFTRQDLIICRNVLIYFDAALQRKLLPLLHYSLKPQGVLLLGSSETIGPYRELFQTLQAKLRFYQRREPALAHRRKLPLQAFPPLSTLAKEYPVTSSNSPSPQPDNLQHAADQVLLQVYAPAAVLLNAAADIVYISGRTGKYLEPAAGKANWNFHAMVREELRAPLALALQQLAAQQAESKPLTLHQLPLGSGEQLRYLDVTLQRFQAPAILQGMTMIVFRELPAQLQLSETALPFSLTAIQQQFSDEIQTLREEARSSKEALQSTNEELQSANEELQSTNEELTTSKEEMQSMNEELQTINTELQTKLDDLALAQSDLQNTLNSVEIAILFLDQQLNVRRYTDRAARIINLRESDLGRPLSDLTSCLQYPQLHEDAAETLRTLKFCEKQIATTDKRWFSVRIMPYRRLDNLIDGVVITMVDITATKQLEAALRE